jgi:hypothetical protein
MANLDSLLGTDLASVDNGIDANPLRWAQTISNDSSFDSLSPARGSRGRPTGGSNSEEPYIRLDDPTAEQTLRRQLKGLMTGPGSVSTALKEILSGGTPDFIQNIGDYAAQSAGSVYGNNLYSTGAQRNITRDSTAAMNESMLPYINTLLGGQQGLLDTFAGMIDPVYAENPNHISTVEQMALDKANDPLLNIVGAISTGASLFSGK